MKKSRYGKYYRAKEFQRKRDEEWIPQIKSMSDNLLAMRHKKIHDAYLMLGLTPIKEYMDLGLLYPIDENAKIELDWSIDKSNLFYKEDSE